MTPQFLKKMLFIGAATPITVVFLKSLVKGGSVTGLLGRL